MLLIKCIMNDSLNHFYLTVPFVGTMIVTTKGCKIMNTRFSTAVHILALIAMNPGNHITSEYMAKSVNTNPVVIRRIAASLKKADLIEVKAGVGGAALLQDPEDITLYDVYCVVNPGESGRLFALHDNTDTSCYVGSNIQDALEMPLAVAQQSFAKSLSATSISDICAFIKTRRDKGHVRVYYSSDEK